MKNIFILILFVVALFAGIANAADWSKYDTGFTSLRVEGYQTQPGYIAFQDGSGAVVGYVFASANGRLYYQCKTAGTPAGCVTGINLGTTKLGTVGGELPLDN